MAGRDRASRQIRSKYRRLLRELKYLYSELEYYTEEHEIRKGEFQEDFLVFCEEYGYDCSTRKTLEKYQEKQFDPYRSAVGEEEAKLIEEEVYNDPSDESIDPSDAEKDLKTLYKKIATCTHPDKLTKEELEATKLKKKQLFMEAKKALENKDFYRLSQIAEELGLELPEPTRQQLVWMRKEKAKIEKIIQGISGTFEWVYGEDNPSMPKINLFYRYVDIIGCVKLQKEG